jgi:TPR repeat protein
MDNSTLESGNVLAYLLRNFADNRTNKNAFAILRCLRDSSVIIPCTMRISDEDMKQFINSKVGNIVQPTSDIGMKPDILINNDTQERFFPVFSQDKQIPDDYRSHFHYLQMAFIEVCDMLKNYKDVNAVVVDPFTVSFTLNEKLLKIVTELPSELGNEEATEIDVSNDNSDTFASIWENYITKGAEKIELGVRVKEHYTNDELTMLVNIAHEVETGKGVFKSDHGLALALYSFCASHGDAMAMNNYGWMILNGMGVTKDTDVAIKAFEGAAAKGLALAMVNLGNIHENMNEYSETDFEDKKTDNETYLNRKGLIDSKYTDYKKAFAWYKRAYELGDLKGAYNYANMLHYGRGVRKNYKEAYEVFERLFKIGYPGAAFYIGLYHQEGFHVKRDYGFARHCYIIGATAGDRSCYNQLGCIYGLGLGVKKDVNFALDYYKTAADLGDALSAVNVGWHYETGAGVIADIVTAREWYEKAAKEDEEQGIKALERIDKYYSALAPKEIMTVEKHYKHIEIDKDEWIGVSADADDEIRETLLPIIEKVKNRFVAES